MLSFLFWVHAALAIIQNGTKRDEILRKGKMSLGVFNVVQFPNVICPSNTSGRNGTCYTSSECTAKGGSGSGSCASSFGVCCVFEKSCGSSTSENSTYFTSADRTLGTACSLTVCKSSSSVCQIRLDFETFVLNDPVSSPVTSPVTTPQQPITIGPTGTAAAGSGNSLGECQTDTFAVSSPCGKAPPVICGTNTGEHMYIPVCDQCNQITSYFGSSSTATTSAFTIKITMIECNSKLKAPEGCTQYFTGTSGNLQTYNYQSGSGTLLYNQDYCACVRAERATCSICYYSYTISSIESFALSVPNGVAGNGLIGFDTVCGVKGIGTTYANGGGFDYITIPNGQCPSPPTAVATPIATVDRYCGTQFKCAATATTASTPNTVCTNSKPFKVCVHSDNAEYAFPAAAGEGTLANNRGFQLGYFQQTVCLSKP